MISLKIQKEPYWLELGYKVKVKVKPCTSAVFYQAKAYMNQKIAAIASEYKKNQDIGVATDLPNLDDIKFREAFADENLTIGMAIAGIIDWEGVLEANNENKAELTETKIEELFSNFWLIAENFRNQYCGIREVLEAEKNDLKPDATGTSAKGENIVKNAPSKNVSAQSPSANT